MLIVLVNRVIYKLKMHISPSNPVIKKVLNDFLVKELYDYTETAYDTDNVVYRVYGNEAAKEFRFAFKCNCAKQILAAGGKEMLEDLYKDYLIPESEWDPDFDVTLRIDLGSMPKT